MTLVIAFHDSDYRTFKHFYGKEVCRHWRAEFSHLVSYSRLIEYLPSVLVLITGWEEFHQLIRTVKLIEIRIHGKLSAEVEA